MRRGVGESCGADSMLTPVSIPAMSSTYRTRSTSQGAVRSVDLARIPELSIAERADGTGTITFGSPATGAAWFGGMPWPGVSGKVTPAFELVAEVRPLYQRVREAQAAAVAAAR